MNRPPEVPLPPLPAPRWCLLPDAAPGAPWMCWMADSTSSGTADTSDLLDLAVVVLPTASETSAGGKGWLPPAPGSCGFGIAACSCNSLLAASASGGGGGGKSHDSSRSALPGGMGSTSDRGVEQGLRWLPDKEKDSHSSTRSTLLAPVSVGRFWRWCNLGACDAPSCPAAAGGVGTPLACGLVAP